MIKAITAFTYEVDDRETAVEELLAQLDLKSNLLKNSVGIISCYSEFIGSGIVKAISDALGFPAVGSTTLSNVVKGTDSSYMLLTLTVLTSDDVSFTVGVSEDILSADRSILERAYKSAAETLDESPKLMISFVPLLMNVGGDFFVNSMNEISGGVPNFGTLSVDHTEDYHEARVIANGEEYVNRYAFILLSGNVTPRFYMAGISQEKIFTEKGIATASAGNQLISVNDKPVGDYLESLGLKRNADGSIDGINSFPFIVDYNDGTEPVIRCMFALTPDGAAVCGGDIPVGATLSVGKIDAAEVVTNTETVLTHALSELKKDKSFMLMFSCVGRYFALGYDPTGELEKAKEILETTEIPFMFAYAGGEICPVYDAERGSTANRNHNDTFIICMI
ncbi:hypothetical protein FACS1894219_08770 [Clostridia bacterium]|nr:hypothetical protein FACS1894219_08770 [Clostridia bacterium]